MKIRKATVTDKTTVLHLLDDFRADCIEQITGQPGSSDTAQTSGVKIFESLLARPDYCILLLTTPDSQAVGIITGYLCPMLRNGEMRAEIEEFFVNKEHRGQGNAQLLMDAFIDWCTSQGVVKVNIESDSELLRAHQFYKKYGFEIKAQRFVKKLP